MTITSVRQSLVAACLIGALGTVLAAPAHAQRPAPARRQADPISVRGFATLGLITFTAQESFDAVLDAHAGGIFGGGGQVLLPRGIFVQVSASRFKQEGERVFVGPSQQVFDLGIPLHLTITPIELTGGWRYQGRGRRGPWRLVPYAGAGYTSVRYQETSDFADSSENVDDWFGGFHVLGGAEYRATRWMAVGGEVAWSSIPDAIGAGGVSAAFQEDDLGGTTIRLKISIGR